LTSTSPRIRNCTGKGRRPHHDDGHPGRELGLRRGRQCHDDIAGSDGIATWAFGYAGDTDMWGAALALAAGNQDGLANFTVTSPATSGGTT